MCIFFLVSILSLTSVTKTEILPCRGVLDPVLIILTNIVVNKENYVVVVDTGSSALWLINKNYTLWQHNHPEQIQTDPSCDLTSHNLSKIDPPNFTRTPPKHEPTADVTTHGEYCYTHRLTFANHWLTVVWHLYTETVTIGRWNFVLPVGGAHKLIVSSTRNLPHSWYGIFGLLPVFENQLNQPNFLFLAKPFLPLPMFALYLGSHDNECYLSLGEQMQGIQRNKLLVVPIRNDTGEWSIKSNFAAEMRFCNGKRKRLESTNHGPSIMIDSGNGGILLPTKMAEEFYQNLGIDLTDIPRNCTYWEAVNPILYLNIDVDILFKLTFDNLILRMPNVPDACFCLIQTYDENEIQLGSTLFKTYYVEFYFDTEQSRRIEFARMKYLKN